MKKIVRMKHKLRTDKEEFSDDLYWEIAELNEKLSSLADAAGGLAALTRQDALDAYLADGHVSASFYSWLNVRLRDRITASGILEAASPFDATGRRTTIDKICPAIWELDGDIGKSSGFLAISVAVGHYRAYYHVGYVMTECKGPDVRITQMFLREQFMGLRIEHRCLNMLREKCRKRRKRLVGLDYVQTEANRAVGALLDEANALGFFSDPDAPDLPTPIEDGSTYGVYNLG